MEFKAECGCKLDYHTTIMISDLPGMDEMR